MRSHHRFPIRLQGSTGYVHTHHPGAHVNAVIERWVLPDWEFDLTETSCRSGYITFMQGGRPQIQMM